MEAFTVKLVRQVIIPISSILLLLTLPQLGFAQQNPHPYSVDFNFGGGLIGNPEINTGLQSGVGFSYLPGSFGVGLNAGYLSYNPAFNAEQYTSGYEEFTSISNNNGKWSSFFLGIGPRFEFGSRLPVTFRSGVDLMVTYNSPPDIAINFNDSNVSSGDSQLQLSSYSPGGDYQKLSAAVRPELQLQFSPGGSDWFAINVTTGIRHRLTKNEFTYTQKDLSNVRSLSSSREMFFQFNNAPDIQRTTNPPQTNFFTTIGINIKFGRSQDYNSSRSNRQPTISSNTGSDGENTVSGTTAYAQDYNAARSNKPTSRSGNDGDLNNEANIMARILHPQNAIVATGSAMMISGENNPLFKDEGEASSGDGNTGVLSSTQVYRLEPNSSVASLSTMQMSTNSQKAASSAPAQDYNSSRSNKPNTIASDVDSDIDSDSTTTTVLAQDYNSSRSNKPNTIASDIDSDIDSDSTTVTAPAQDYNSSRSNKPRTRATDINGDGFPDILKNASFSISKRSARTADGNSDSDEDRSDINGAFHFNLEIDDPDSDDDGLMDVAETSTFSISKSMNKSAVNDDNPLHEDQTNEPANPLYEPESAENNGGNENSGYEQIHIWTYNLSPLMNSEAADRNFGDDFEGSSLQVMRINEQWHYNLNLAQGADQDDFSDLLQNSSFSISKRSARTGRN